MSASAFHHHHSEEFLCPSEPIIRPLKSTSYPIDFNDCLSLPEKANASLEKNSKGDNSRPKKSIMMFLKERQRE